MGTVLGPFDQDDFVTMQNLKADVKHLRKLGSKWAFVIDKELDTLREYMTREAA